MKRETKNRLVAVLEIGSTGIRLLVAEILENGRWREVDRAGKPVALGRDVFTTRRVSRNSFLECLTVLHGFKELLAGWGITDRDVHIIATSALRAADNRDIFVDRVRLETNFRITIVDGIEENRLMYLAVRFALKQDLPLFWQANSMIIDIGGGSTEIMLLHDGKMVAAHSLNLGTILIERQARRSVGSTRYQERYLKEIIRNTAGRLRADMDLSTVKTFVMAGSDIRLAARIIGKPMNEHCMTVSRAGLLGFVQEIQHYTMETCVQRLGISFSDAEGFVPGILVYKQFLEQTGTEEVVVPDVSIREGLLIDLAFGVDSELQEEFFSQIIASAANLGRKYHFDEEHNRLVADLSLEIFDALTHEHGMNRRERMLLEVAALLHDIGMFIGGENHQQHGRYIVAHSEIFGLHRDELDIVSSVIGYHRGKPPSPTDIHYLSLQREDRILVLKMASILRVADALDRGHSQQIKHITVERRGESVALRTKGSWDISLELIGLEEKADLFQGVYGYKILLT